jgi:hypothetical protein
MCPSMIRKLKVIVYFRKVFRLLLIAGIENGTFKLNEIKMNDNREIFEVPGVYENPRRQTITLAFFYSLCKMSEIHGVRPQGLVTIFFFKFFVC